MQRAFPSLLPSMSQSAFSAGNTTGITKKFTGAPFWILVAMQEMYPTKSICADMHIQAMKYWMKHTPKSHGVSLNIYHI